MSKRLETALIAGLLIALLITPLTGFGLSCVAVRSGVLRLHIMAASDSDEDQRIKLAVRDAVLAASDGIFDGCVSLDEAEAAAEESLPRLLAAAEAELEAQGSGDGVRAELVNMYFETREYGSITLPAGSYDALRFVIGDGKGANWWCVMFPPLCLGTAVEESDALRALKELDGRPEYKLSLWSVEQLERLFASRGGS